MSAILALIVAVSDNAVIGRNNALPWNLPGDLQYFRRITWGKPIIMGRKTYESLQRPLPGRTNIVVTRNAQFEVAAGIRVVQSVDRAIELAQAIAALDGVDEIFVIGGAQLYQACMQRAQRLYITQVHAQFEGDAYFAPYAKNQWKEISREHRGGDEQSEHAFSFVVLERVSELSDAH